MDKDNRELTRKKPALRSLFELIKSLNRSEKRYFKVYAARHTLKGQHVHVDLFDLMDRLDAYQEEALCDLLKFSSQTSVKVNFLYRLILKGLHAYSLDGRTNLAIRRQIGCAEILYDKGLYGQAMNVIKKARKEAERLQKFQLLLEIIPCEMIILKRLDLGNFGKHLERLRDEERRYLELISEQRDYDLLQAKVLGIQARSGTPRTEGIQSTYNEIRKELKARARQAFGSFRAEFYHMSTAMITDLETGNLKDGYTSGKKLMSLWDRYPEQIPEEPHNYITSLNNHLVCCIRLKRYDEGVHLIEKMRSLSVMSADIAVKRFEYVFSNGPGLYVAMGAYEKVVALSGEVEDGLLRYENKLSKLFRTVIYSNMAIAHFATGRYRQALSWCNRLLNETGTLYRNDVHSIARILQLLIYVELGEELYISYAIKNTYRFLCRKEMLYRFEEVLLRFFRRLPALTGDSSLRKAYRELKLKLLPLRKYPFEREMLDMLNLIPWLDGKIGGGRFPPKGFFLTGE